MGFIKERKENFVFRRSKTTRQPRGEQRGEEYAAKKAGSQTAKNLWGVGGCGRPGRIRPGGGERGDQRAGGKGTPHQPKNAKKKLKGRKKKKKKKKKVGGKKGFPLKMSAGHTQNHNVCDKNLKPGGGGGADC